MKKIVVQKYGGSSLSTIGKVKKIAKKIVARFKEGNQIVVVVSAMGNETDRLLKLAYRISSAPDKRELDMLVSTGEQVSIALLAMAIHVLGNKAISFTARHAGTDGIHTRSRLIKINSQKIEKTLNLGKIVIVAGFQGINHHDEVTTLGRGGSDLSAVALAVQLKADLCEIYTDVDGVYTANPKLISEAQRIPKISYDEMSEMTALGAQVMHHRAIDLARKYHLPILVKSTFRSSKGTMITKEVPMLENVIVRGVTYQKNVAKITLQGVKKNTDLACRLFEDLAKENIVIDSIVQDFYNQETVTVSFIVTEDDFISSLKITKKIAGKIGVQEIHTDCNLAKVSIVGDGIAKEAGIAARMFHALSRASIHMETINTSRIRISCLIKLSQLDGAVKAIHEEFELSKIKKEI
jgi:aspartate kinase